MRLFWTPASPFVRKVVVVAAELDLLSRIEIVPTFWPHEWATKTVDFDPAFVAANPIGRIPTLVTDDGLALPESNHICNYLNSISTSRLFTSHEDARWSDARLLAIADGALEAMILRRAETLRRGAEKSANFIGKQVDRVARCFDVLERDLDFGGTTLTLAHVATGVGCGFMDFRYAEDSWRTARPRLTDWYEKFSKRQSMTQSAPAETPQKG